MTINKNESDDSVGIPLLTVKLRVTYEFIPHFEEEILLSLREGVCESELT